MVVGTGLGGLLTGAFMAKQGHEVVLVEALDLVGGRFTHVNYEGFAVPTGALHALPGGASGPIAQCLDVLDVQVELAEPKPSFWIVSGGETRPLDLGPQEGDSGRKREAFGVEPGLRTGLRALKVGLRSILGLDTSMHDVFHGISENDYGMKVADHICKFGLGVSAKEASLLEVMRSLRVQKSSREAFIRGGNRHLVTSIHEKALASGATLRTRTPVTRIVVEGKAAVGVRTAEGEHIPAEHVVSNVGAMRTLGLLREHAPRSLAERVRKAIPAHGVAYAVRSTRRMHEHDGIELPIDLRNIAGIVPVSLVCPDLCPPGWHYSLAYQALDRAMDTQMQIQDGQKEIEDYLGAPAEVFNIAVYQGKHPAAFMAQCVGQHGRARFPAFVSGIKNLLLVGHDVRGYGTAAEVIGDSCLRLWRGFL